MFVQDNTDLDLDNTDKVLLAAIVEFSGTGAQQFVITANASSIFNLNSAATAAKIFETNDRTKDHKSYDGNNPNVEAPINIYQKANAWMAIRLSGGSLSNAATADSLGPNMLQTLAVSASFTVNPGRYTIQLIGRGAGSKVTAKDRSMVIGVS